MESRKTYTFQMTHPAPIVWHYLITPKPEHTVGTAVFKEAYEATFVFSPDHPDRAALGALLQQAAAEGAPGVANPRLPVVDGTMIANKAEGKREWARGAALFKADSKTKTQKGLPIRPPNLFVVLNGEYVSFGVTNERALASKYFWGGVLAVGAFSIEGYPGMGGGVTAYLNDVASTNAGDRLTVETDPVAKFGDPRRFMQHVGHASAINPSEGLANSIM